MKGFWGPIKYLKKHVELIILSDQKYEVNITVFATNNLPNLDVNCSKIIIEVSSGISDSWSAKVDILTLLSNNLILHFYDMVTKRIYESGSSLDVGRGLRVNLLSI